ncbi:hypothetical protein HPP92_022760 [Vanilla planifolia]|uniref:CASP-like protein n=1 Tax=Vanilla planifolia TaxID=51239 RepID=A0A835PY37_VANPL|nr:hypothetical protein HPP92_022760 [Vanilla planifolia]
MDSGDAVPSTAIAIGNGSSGAGTRDIAPPPAAVRPRRSLFARFLRRETKTRGGWKRGLAIFDFLLRILAIAALVAAAILMGTDDDTLPFFTEDYQFSANFADLPAFTFLVIADGIAAGYLLLSIPFSIVCIVRPVFSCPRLFLLIFDLLAVALTVAAAASAAAIVYLAHTGNSKANWVPFCIRFQDFCQQSSGAVVATFVGALIVMLMVVMSALALRKK